jgi:hypothetical protein
MKYEILSPRVGEPGTEYVPEEGVNIDALIEGGFIKASKTNTIKAVEKDTETNGN